LLQEWYAIAGLPYLLSLLLLLLPLQVADTTELQLFLHLCTQLSFSFLCSSNAFQHAAAASAPPPR
jgi:hypothetical protein